MLSSFIKDERQNIMLKADPFLLSAFFHLANTISINVGIPFYQVHQLIKLRSSNSIYTTFQGLVCTFQALSCTFQSLSCMFQGLKRKIKHDKEG